METEITTTIKVLKEQIKQTAEKTKELSASATVHLQTEKQILESELKKAEALQRLENAKDFADITDLICDMERIHMEMFLKYGVDLKFEVKHYVNWVQWTPPGKEWQWTWYSRDNQPCLDEVQKMFNQMREVLEQHQLEPVQ